MEERSSTYPSVSGYFYPGYAPGWNFSSSSVYHQYQNPLAPPTREEESDPSPSSAYTLRIIDPKKRSNYKTVTWHDVSLPFESVLSLKAKIAESFPNDVAHDLGFHVGYYHGRGSTKRWLVEDRDLTEMYKKSGKRSINLWCESVHIDEDEPPPAKKPRTKREAMEDGS